MIAYMLLLMVSALGFGASRYFRIPVIPLLLFLGTVLSFAGIRAPEKMVENTVVLGLTFLVFASGIELNPLRFRPQKDRVPWVALSQFAVIGLVGFFAGSLAGLDPVSCLYVGFALSASSTLVVVRHLKLNQQMFEPFGRLVVGVLLVQDVIIILTIVLLTNLQDGAGAIATGMLSAIGLGLLAMGFQKWVVPLVFLKLKLDEEATLLAVLAVLFTFVGIGTAAGLPMVAGAFFGGFALSACPINGIVRGQLNSLTDFSLSLFFVMVGGLVTLPDPAMLLKVSLFVGIVVVLTPPLVTLVAELTGMNSRSAIESGLLLSQTSEYSIVLALTGVYLGHVSAEVFSVIVLTTIVTMVLTPFLATDRMTWRLMHLHPLRHRGQKSREWKDHVLVIGFGSGGMWMIKPLLESGNALLVIDDDPSVIEKLNGLNIPCMRGDGSDPKVLQRAHAHQAKVIIGHLRRAVDSEKILQQIKDVPIMMRVFEKKDAERIRELGGIPILNSEAAAVTFMEWFDSVLSKPDPRT